MINYKPEVLVVENEESSTLSYTGTPSQYHQELKVACEIAHSKGIKCANGGLVSSLVVFMVENDFRERCQEVKAEDYLRRALRDQDDLYQQYLKTGGFDSKLLKKPNREKKGITRRL